MNLLNAHHNPSPTIAILPKGNNEQANVKQSMDHCSDNDRSGSRRVSRVALLCLPPHGIPPGTAKYNVSQSAQRRPENHHLRSELQYVSEILQGSKPQASSRRILYSR